MEEATADYLASFELIYPYADYVAVNVSSPNTPGLRELQRADALASLLLALQNRNDQLSALNHKPSLPLLVKIAPDLDTTEIEAIVDVARRVRIAGIIATNTTTSRANLQTRNSAVENCGEGGLSGAPLRQRSTDVIKTLYQLTKGQTTIIGVGGIFTAEDAWEKISAGASLLQTLHGIRIQGMEHRA